MIVSKLKLMPTNIFWRQAVDRFQTKLQVEALALYQELMKENENVVNIRLMWKRSLAI
ncbi:hypothetical protein [Lactobacillus sp. B4005]|uniref:hypothetical protein n=1 Tax=Lactobacillus sp. B4005 TaxID=2818031 RepID=UPI002269F0B5|nr:hypothetical protein [Lactobacillus sp. B4005]MCX8723573.1 hypothetical protein [Lactobacillus sp. B4005]